MCGPLLDKYGIGASIWVQWLLGIILTTLCSIQVLQVQVASMVAFAAFRAFHFSNMTVYLSRTFGYATLSVTIATVVLVGGCIGQLQSPLLRWALDSPTAFLDPSLTMLGVQIACFAFPLWNTLYRRAAAAKAAANAAGGSSKDAASREGSGAKAFLALPSPASPAGAAAASTTASVGGHVELAAVAHAVTGTAAAVGPVTVETIGVVDSVGGSALLARAPSDGGFAVGTAAAPSANVSASTPVAV